MARLALTRPVSASIQSCALSYLERTPIDLAIARAQHRAYERALEEVGCRVERLPAAEQLPDAVFVEDTAVVLDEIAVIARPGAASRRPELQAVAERLGDLRPLAAIDAPATLDGGDVLRAGRTLYVGLTTRTDRRGLESLRRIVLPLGYRVVPVAVRGCLHLKSAASWLGEDRILIDPEHVEAEALGGMELLPVPTQESAAANVLLIGETVMVAEGYPRTRRLLADAGLECLPVVNTELAKAEGGLSCCSLILEQDEPGPPARGRHPGT